MASKDVGAEGSRNRWRGRGVSSRTRNTQDEDSKDVLKVGGPWKYARHSEILEKTKVLGSYSLNREREFIPDKPMNYFLDPKYMPDEGKLNVHIDLNVGWDKFNRYAGNSEDNFHYLLRWILNNQEQIIDRSSQRLTADFVSMKGNFVRVMKTPYNPFPWTVWAKEYKGSVYIMNSENDKECRIIGNAETLEKWGHTFEDCIRGGNPEEGVDANGDYRCILTTEISGMSLMFSTGIDCAEKEKFEKDFEDLSAFLSVKSSFEISAKNRKYFEKVKLIQWWADNQVQGIPHILVGYRTKKGIVHTLELLKTDELPELAKGQWDPSVAFNFLAEFLKFVKERVSQDPGATYVFDREEKGNIRCRKLTAEDHINLLPGWYTKELFADESDSNDESE